MAKRETAAEALAALEERYGVEELSDLSRLSGVPRQTLVNWKNKPSAELRTTGRRYLRDAEERAPSNADLAAALARIEQRLDALLTLRGEPERIEQMVKAKARAKAGGGAA